MKPQPSKVNATALSREPERGLGCPRCGCRHLPVLYTRPRARSIVRCRECRHCGKRIVTREQA